VELGLYLSLEPDGWLLALDEGQPVGMVGAVMYDRLAYVGLMAVHQRAQKRGIGRRLMETLLAKLDGSGCPQVELDATEVGAGLYCQLGFVAEGRPAVYLQRNRSQAGERSLPEGISRLRPEELKELAVFDAPLFGAQREQVLGMYLAEWPGRALVARDPAGQIRGYLFAQPARLGPWAALDEESAQGLLEAGLCLPFERAPRVIVPDRNELAGDLLTRHGFELADGLHAHMRRGGPGQPGQRGRIFGQASYAIG
jgi:hypothetical protein